MMRLYPGKPLVHNRFSTNVNSNFLLPKASPNWHQVIPMATILFDLWVCVEFLVEERSK